MSGEMVGVPELPLHLLDAEAVAFYLAVPRQQIGLLQTFFELYDGVGTVRTLEGEQGTVAILTTPTQAEDCRAVLGAIREQVRWEPALPPPSL